MHAGPNNDTIAIEHQDIGGGINMCTTPIQSFLLGWDGGGGGRTIGACGGGGGAVGVVGCSVGAAVSGVEALEEGGAEREDLGEGDAAAAAAGGGRPAAAEGGVGGGVVGGGGEEEEEAILEAVGADADDELPGVEAAVGAVALAMAVRRRLVHAC
jgi:hypothetical protein